MTDTQTQPDDIISLKYLWAILSRKWVWFILSIAICVSIAMAYIIITPPEYTINATLLVKNNDKGKSGMPSNAEAFSNMGLFNQNTDIKNEIHIFKSPSLMEKVVERLKLDYNYSIKYRSVRDVDLYNASPVIVKLDSTLANQYLQFEIHLGENNDIAISNLSIENVKHDFSATGTIAHPILTPYGTITILPTALYQTQVGETIYFTKHTTPYTAKLCGKELSVVLSNDDAAIIALSYTDVSSQRAKDILNTLISIYNENWIKDKNQVTNSTSEFINERLRVIESELGNVDDDISSYKSANLIPDVGAVSSIYLTQSTNNATQLSTLQNQLSMANYIQNYLSKTASNNILIPANTGIGNTSIETQIEQYNSLLLQKNNLESNSSATNPIVADMIQTLNSMKDVIVRSMNEYISTLNIQIDNIRKEEQTTNRKIATNPNQAKYLLSVERQQKVKEELYLFLLQKREENELSQAFTAYNTRIVNEPDSDNIPSSPRKNIILLAAFVIGVLLPVIVIVFAEQFKTHVENRKDLAMLTIPFLGEIPFIKQPKEKLALSFRKKKDDKPKEVPILIQERSRNHVNEAFRIIRTNLDFMRPKDKGNAVIMTTSAYPGSGKTFTSINLAMSMALKGSKVIIIDADLRVAALSRVVGSPKRGISDYLCGNEPDIEKVLIKSHLNANLDILPVGTLPPNPSELLLTEKFEQLIASFKKKYDYVFLDCPPTELVTDAAIISHVCDLTIFVIRAGLMEKSSLPEVENSYKNNQFNNMAIILNAVDISERRYGYGKYGYYKYGYYEAE